MKRIGALVIGGFVVFAMAGLTGLAANRCQDCDEKQVVMALDAPDLPRNGLTGCYLYDEEIDVFDVFISYRAPTGCKSNGFSATLFYDNQFVEPDTRDVEWDPDGTIFWTGPHGFHWRFNENIRLYWERGNGRPQLGNVRIVRIPFKIVGEPGDTRITIGVKPPNVTECPAQDEDAAYFRDESGDYWRLAFEDLLLCAPGEDIQ